MVDKYGGKDTPGNMAVNTRTLSKLQSAGTELSFSPPPPLQLCNLESVCGQACVYRHIARCVFTTIFINQSVESVGEKAQAPV